MKRICGILLTAVLAASCFKDVPPADIVGSWQSVHEDWTITTNGNRTTMSFDLKTDDPDDFAQLQLVHSSMYVLSSKDIRTTEKTMTMYYSDRFTPLQDGTSKHAKITASVKIKYGKFKYGKAYWGVRSLTDDTLVLEYDSGRLDVDGATVQRKCRFVFEKTWDKVIRQ